MTLASPAVRFALLALLLVAVAHLLDPWAQVNVSDPDVYGDDLGRMFRVIGYYPLWVLVGAALILQDRGDVPREARRWSSGLRRGGLLLLTPALGGLVAELGKLLFRRLRPGEVPGEYVFRAFGERPLYSGGLGLPSSHTLVAFAGAAILARLFPRGAPVWFFLAAGCGFTRVEAGAHYLSDVVVAGILGWTVAWAVWRSRLGKGKGPETVREPAVATP